MLVIKIPFKLKSIFPMKLFRLYFLLGCSFLINAFQANAQCSITNLTVTSITCTPNGANQDLTYCGTFTAANTNGSYDFEAFHQANAPIMASLNLATDGLISFCVTIPNVPFIPEGLAVGEAFNMTCSASFATGLPSPCPATQACALSNLNVSNICCGGNGGLRVIGNFTAANASGNYNVSVFGIAIPPNFANVQIANIQSASMNGVVNFDVVIPNFNFNDAAGGISIEDNIFAGCSSNLVSGAIPAEAACPSCTPPAAPIPTMNQWGILIFALLMINLGLIFVYRKQAQLN